MVLASKNMLNYEGDDAESDARRLNAKTTEAVEKKNLRKGGGTLVLDSDDEDSDFGDGRFVTVTRDESERAHFSEGRDAGRRECHYLRQRRPTGAL